MTPTLESTIQEAIARARERCPACDLGYEDHTCDRDLAIVERVALAAVGRALRPFNQHGWADMKAEIERQFGLREGSERGKE